LVRFQLFGGIYGGKDKRQELGRSAGY